RSCCCPCLIQEATGADRPTNFLRACSLNSVTRPCRAAEADVQTVAGVLRHRIRLRAAVLGLRHVARRSVTNIGSGSPWMDFGNRQTGTIVDTFWLDGPLEINAVEEARFVARLAQQKLDASIRSQSIARDIIRLESRDGKVLYGKTGWRFSSAPNLGWWTG